MKGAEPSPKALLKRIKKSSTGPYVERDNKVTKIEEYVVRGYRRTMANA